MLPLARWGGSTRPVASFLLQAEQLLVRGTQQLRHAGHGRASVAVLCTGKLIAREAVLCVVLIQTYADIAAHCRYFFVVSM